jgi:hypothetical protein
MTPNEAQTIVYAFVDEMADRMPFVGDEDTLPYPKESIRIAMAIHIQHYESLMNLNPEAFKKLGHDKDLEALKAMRVRIDDWHKIDQCDKELVAKVNLEKSLPVWGLPLVAKYMSRRESQRRD